MKTEKQTTHHKISVMALALVMYCCHSVGYRVWIYELRGYEKWNALARTGGGHV